MVYALDAQGALRARIGLDGAMATDIEDIAVGPCGDDSCVYLGDIGDNAAARAEYAVLRFVEPNVPSSAGAATLSASFERFRFTYEDGSHNAEGLMVGPDGSVYVVTKLAPGSGGNVPASGPSSVYRLRQPLSAASVAVATRVATLPVPATGDLAASAAAAHPCGLGFLLRTYDKVYEFRTPQGAPFEMAFTVAPTSSRCLPSRRAKASTTAKTAAASSRPERARSADLHDGVRVTPRDAQQAAGLRAGDGHPGNPVAPAAHALAPRATHGWKAHHSQAMQNNVSAARRIANQVALADRSWSTST